jgi:hypothetical protein
MAAIPEVGLAPARRLAWRPALDELVLLHGDTGQSWLLDPAGAVLWLALVEAGSVTGAVERLAGADPEEVAAFADRLVAEGAMVETEPDG